MNQWPWDRTRSQFGFPRKRTWDRDFNTNNSMGDIRKTGRGAGKGHSKRQVSVKCVTKPGAVWGERGALLLGTSRGQCPHTPPSSYSLLLRRLRELGYWYHLQSMVAGWVLIPQSRCQGKPTGKETGGQHWGVRPMAWEGITGRASTVSATVKHPSTQ